MLSSKKRDMPGYSSYFGDSGETAYPFSLHDICLDYLCNNLNEICVTKTIVVTPKRRRVNSGTNQSYIDETDSGNELKIGIYQNTGAISKLRGTSSNATEVEGVDRAVLISPNLKPILPKVSENYFEAESPNSRKNLNNEDERLCCPHSELSNTQHTKNTKDDYLRDNVKQVMRFPRAGEDETVYLHTELSEQLLDRLCQNGNKKNQITDLKLSLFDPDCTRLRSVRLRNTSKLTIEGIKILRGHGILDLEIHGLANATISDVIGECLGNWTIKNMKTLNVSNSLLMLPNRQTTLVYQLTKLKGLTSLNVSGTGFNATSLEIIVESLCNLENLDISCTKVGDISCLTKLKHIIRKLNLYGLTFAPNSEILSRAIQVLSEMKELRYLDISDEKDIQHPFEMLNPNQGKIPAVQFLSHSMKNLPCLISLDLSGKEDLRSDVEGVTSCVKEFIDLHPNLTYLGLSLTNLCKADLFGTKRSPTETCPLEYERYCPPQLIVSGYGDERQILESLQRYGDRPIYVQKTFYHLFQLTQGYATPRIDMIELVFQCSMKYQTVFAIQMAATACLYNLSKEKSGQKLHPKVLSKIVKVDLDAMEAFPQHQQLQKNVLLTLCNDRILQEVNFDKYRCARLVMDCLCAWPDASMNRMSVAICSILAAKITTRETSRLGSTSKYMSKLLHIVRTKTDAKDLDVTLKFTLSALWNLTDESPNTCKVFLDEGGMDLFLGVLQTFPSEVAIETKVLGLLNNIAEVKELRNNIMDSRFIQELRKLMKSAKIEVSYFAAGIVAHLASDSFESWNLPTVPKKEITDELTNIVAQWETPESEMVAYRSFTPFFPLMAENQEYSVQLWAVWAIHHVCSKNPKRYLPMLVYQEGIKVILTLVDAKVEGMVLRLSQEVLDIVVKQSVMSQSVLSALRKEVELERNAKLYKTEDEETPNISSKSIIHSNSLQEISSQPGSAASQDSRKNYISSNKLSKCENKNKSGEDSDSTNDEYDEECDSSDGDVPMQELNN